MVLRSARSRAVLLVQVLLEAQPRELRNSRRPQHGTAKEERVSSQQPRLAGVEAFACHSATQAGMQGRCWHRWR